MDVSSLISIVVPVYNVEPFVKRCIDSIKSQTYENLEIFLIDDGSTDSSGKIADRAAASDSRITVIHKKNEGLAEARNVGLRLMRGEYVAFIDSDDFVSENYIMHMAKACVDNRADLVISRRIELFEDRFNQNKSYHGQDFRIHRCERISQFEVLRRMLYMRDVGSEAFAKLFKASLFRDVEFPYGKLYEDIATTTCLVLHADKIISISNADYYYLQRRNSIQRTKFNSRHMDIISQINETGRLATTRYPTLDKAFSCKRASAFFNVLFKIPDGKNYDNDRDRLIRYIKQDRIKVLTDRNARFKTRMACLLSFFSISFVHKVYSVLSR